MYYFIRTNSKDQYIITGYPSPATLKTVAGRETKSTGVKFFEGDINFDLRSGKFGKDVAGASVRSYIKSAQGAGSSGGQFAIYTKTSDGKPNDTGLRFKDSSSANTFIKAVVDVYGELWVLELDKVGAAEKPDLDIEFSEDPF